MKKALLLSLLLLSFFLAAKGEEKGFFKVVLPEKPTKTETAAAAELKNYLGKLYTKPIVFQGKKIPLLTFYVGKKARNTEEKIPYPEFFLRAGKDFIHLAGHDDPKVGPWDMRGETGTLLAVYYFLRKYAGLAVFAPGEKGEKLTLDTPLEMPSLVVPRPSYPVRYISTATKSRQIPSIDRLKYFKKMLCHMPDYAYHEIYYMTLNSWNKRFKDRPELFALHEGKRVNKIYPRHLPCFSNPEVWKIMEKDVLKAIASRKNVHGVRFFSDAPVKICECENCSKEKDISNYFYTNFNKLAALIHKKHPKLYFHTQEKMGYYYRPPKGVKLTENMVVEIASGFPSAKGYSHNVPLFEAWKKAGAKTLIRFYARIPFWKDYPITNPRAIVKHYAFMQPHALGTRTCDGGKVSYYQVALLQYLQAEALFDHTIDAEKAMNTFFALAYPGAEKELMEYYTWMEKCYFSYPSWMNPLHGALQYKNLLVGEKILEKALKKCRDPHYLRPLYEDLVRVRRLAEKHRPLMDYHNAFMEKYKKAMAGKFPLRIPYSPDGKKWESWMLRPSDPVPPPFQEGTVKVSHDGKNIYFILDGMETEFAKVPFVPGKVQGNNTFEVIIAPPNRVHFPYIQLMTACVSQAYWIGIYPESRLLKYLPAKGIRVKEERSADGKKFRMYVTLPLSYTKGVLQGNKGVIGIFRFRFLKGEKGAKGLTGLQRSGLKSGNFHDYSTYLPFTLEEK